MPVTIEGESYTRCPAELVSNRDYWSNYALQIAGRRCREMNLNYGESKKPLVPNGWVARDLPAEILDIIHPDAELIPYEPSNDFGKDARKAQKEFARLQRLYGKGIFMAMVANDDSPVDWSAGPVLVDDLKSEPGALLKSARETLVEGAGVEETDSDRSSQLFERYEMLIRAYTLVTGIADLHSV